MGEREGAEHARHRRRPKSRRDRASHAVRDSVTATIAKPMLPRTLAAATALLAALALAAVSCHPSESEGEAPSALSDQGRTGRPTEGEVVARYAELFASNGGTFWPNTWLGISTLQNPNDVWVTQEILSELKPDFVIETGTYHGGSALIWAMVLEQVNPNGRVITVDIENRSWKARSRPIWRRRIEFMLGSSTAPEIVNTIAERTRGKRVVVLLDSNHSREHVLAELDAYAPMVPVGSYLIVQDTGGVMTKDRKAGPRQAVEAFLASRDDFVPDRERERMLFTMHPKGYLKRVRPAPTP